MQQLEQVVRRLEREGRYPERLILTKEGMDGATVRSMLDEASALGMTLARLPRLTEFKSGTGDRIEVRPVDVEDLLGRPQTPLDRSLSVSDILSSDPSDLLERFPSYVIDNVEYVFGNRGAEQALLHIYNLVAESGRRMLLTAAYPPARFEIQLPDLRSRLRAAPVVGIGAPDDNLIRAVVVKLFVDRQLMVDDSVINYLFARMERSFDAARRLVERIDEESLRNKQKISIPLVRRVLQQDTSTENP